MNIADTDTAPSQADTDTGCSVSSVEARSVGLAMEVAREFVERPLIPSRLPRDQRQRAEVLLGAMVLCYARGWFRSEDVEREAKQNSAVRWMTAGTGIAASEVRAFRLRHFSLVASCLAEFVLRSAVLRPGEVFAAEAIRLRRAVAEKHATERLAVAVLNDAAVV